MASIYDSELEATIDTGSFVTLLSNEVFEKAYEKGLKTNPDLKRPFRHKFSANVLDASGNILPISGTFRTEIVTPAGKFPVSILLFEEGSAVGFELLLGMDVLRHCNINFLENKFKFFQCFIPEAE